MRLDEGNGGERSCPVLLLTSLLLSGAFRRWPQAHSREILMRPVLRLLDSKARPWDPGERIEVGDGIDGLVPTVFPFGLWVKNSRSGDREVDKVQVYRPRTTDVSPRPHPVERLELDGDGLGTETIDPRPWCGRGSQELGQRPCPGPGPGDRHWLGERGSPPRRLLLTPPARPDHGSGQRLTGVTGHGTVDAPHTPADSQDCREDVANGWDQVSGRRGPLGLGVPGLGSERPTRRQGTPSFRTLGPSPPRKQIPSLTIPSLLRSDSRSTLQSPLSSQVPTDPEGSSTPESRTGDETPRTPPEPHSHQDRIVVGEHRTRSHIILNCVWVCVFVFVVTARVHVKKLSCGNGPVVSRRSLSGSQTIPRPQPFPKRTNHGRDLEAL